MDLWGFLHQGLLYFDKLLSQQFPIKSVKRELQVAAWKQLFWDCGGQGGGVDGVVSG